MELNKRSEETSDFNIEIGLFQKKSKLSQVNFLSIYKYYNSNSSLSLRKLSKLVNVPSTSLFEKFAKIDELQLYLH